jgi:murein DD-endopeptidase MepM/ murein hydrolase activator NlpD
VTERYDPQAGNSLVLDATTPYKCFAVTSQLLSAPGSGNPTNAAFALALAQLTGIGARDLIRFCAAASQYPGSLAAISPNPGGLHLYSASEPEYVGQRSLSLPDNASTSPDLQTYAAILGGLTADTGMELWFDEFGSLVFRPIAYLASGARPYRIDDDDILEAELALSDQDVVSQVRVRWMFDQYWVQDGYAPLATDAQTSAGVRQLAAHLGTRTLVVDAPWMKTRDGADFLAASLLQQFASGVAVGTLTTPANPAVRAGSVIDVPALTPGMGHSYYYVLQKNYALQWGAAWTETLTLAYGRDPTAGFPYIGTQSRPDITSSVFNTRGGGGAEAGVSTGTGGLVTTPTGQQAYSYPLHQDTTLAPGDASGPYPVGTVIRVADQHGNPLGDSPNGDYTISKSDRGQDTSISLSNTQGQTQTSNVIVVVFGTATDTTTSGSGSSGMANPPAQQGTPAVPQPGSGGSPPVSGNPGATPAGPQAVPSFAYFPLAGYKSHTRSQPFGPTNVSGEPPNYSYRGPTDPRVPPHWVHDTTYPLFHTGIDIPCPPGTPVRAPTSGIIVKAGWDTSGYGNLIVLQAGQLLLYFGHLQACNVKAGDLITVTARADPVLGQADYTGHVLPADANGSHLHFGVWDSAYQDYVDPEPYLINARDS